MADNDKPLPSLDKLQKEIDEARGVKAEEKQNFSASQQGLDQAMRMGVELVAGVMVGSVFGYFVDQWLGTMPLFFVICFFLGAVAGFRNMIRNSRTTDESDNINKE